ncbi:monofunctional biosynthetic peptidoglycan transglycosylase [Tropicimonas sp. S265A]|uniref:monofunctional biosynthetic peptidoglycan transglycosylase n=1 Tax=Tropicimonas sp. S265A TaxID=3415134 RepID=UPI003C7E879E
MATKKKKPSKPRSKAGPKTWWQSLRRWVVRAALAVVAVFTVWVLVYSVVPVYATPYMLAERWRHGELDNRWTPIDDIAPVMARSAVAAEDANFCRHWGFDMSAIRDAIAEGGQRGASTISQQVTKNAFLWQGRSWPRKAMEAALTPAVELVWSKQRIIEVYLNIAEFDTGVFGVAAAAEHYYGVSASDLTASQAARLAVVLPNPKQRSPKSLSPTLMRRAAQVEDGAETIRRDGRAACFED